MFAIDWHLLIAMLTLAAFLIVLAGHLVLSTIVWRRFSAQVSVRGRVLMLLLLLGTSVGTYVVMLAVAFPIAVVGAGSPPYSDTIEQWVLIGTFGLILAPTATFPQLLGVHGTADYRELDVVIGVAILLLLGFLAFSLRSRFRVAQRSGRG